MKARNIMTTDVVTVSPDTTVNQIASLLLKHRISAVPVTHDGSVVGIVSEGDLMHRPESDTERAQSWWLRVFTDSDTQARDYAKTHGRRAIDVMTRHVVSVTEETPVGDIASLLDFAPHQARSRHARRQARRDRQPCRPSPRARCRPAGFHPGTDG